MSEEATITKEAVEQPTQKVAGVSFGDTTFLLGKKLHMTQIFNEQAQAVPGTIIELLPMVITQIKTSEQDGYDAIQLGVGERKEKNINKAQKTKGAFEFFKEVRLSAPASDLKVGDVISHEQIAVGDKVAVTSISKGKGFQGAVKRHGFSGGRRSHGNKHHERTVGSIGVGGVGHVIKGKKMPGRMGSDRITVKGLKVTHLDPQGEFIVVKGAIPGREGTVIELRA